MSTKRNAVLDAVCAAVQANQPTTELEAMIFQDIGEYIKMDRFAALPFRFLLRLVEVGSLKLSADQVCQIFVGTVPYNGYESIQLLKNCNFRAASDQALQQMREIIMQDGVVLKLPMIGEIIALRDDLAVAQECLGARTHDFDCNGICKKCYQGRCIGGSGVLTAVHNFSDDGRCGVCGAPRCKFDNLHVFNYDGHCYICGKAQPTRCEVVGCKAIHGEPNCSICGKLIGPNA
jgi:hypothetical protein